MTAQAVLNEAQRLGIIVEAHGSTLHIDAPARVLTPELRAALTDRKSDLLARLAPAAPFVLLKGALVVPRPALELALALEERGFAMALDAAQHVVIEPTAALTAGDRAAIQHWQRHLAAILTYQCPSNEIPQ